MEEKAQPKGIGFFNIKSGETHYCRLEPTIAAYINSSDMGINASRGQDFGWRLEPDWVRQVKAFRRDEQKMQMLLTRNGGQKPSTTQILYSIYGEQMRAYEQQLEDDDSPFEQEYLKEIGEKAPVADTDELDNFDEVANQDEPTPAPEKEAGAPDEKPAKKK